MPHPDHWTEGLEKNGQRFRHLLPPLTPEPRTQRSPPQGESILDLAAPARAEGGWDEGPGHDQQEANQSLIILSSRSKLPFNEG